ncbi:YceI family protein, partial [Flavobacteriales bacterium]|nr:YceI family protein [Flavobacteriales bacterium]
IQLFFFVSCSAPVKSESINEPEEKQLSEKQEYVYTLGEVLIKWTAFKHTAKAQVGGAFKSAVVKGFTESTNLNTAVSGVTFEIPVNSTSTNDTVRDYKIVNSFFRTMVNTDNITGKIISLDNNGTGLLTINMNNVEVQKSFTWEMDQATKEIYIKTAIDVLNWGAQSSLDALNEVCLEQHTGPDGKNILWPNVDITIIVDL